MLVFAPNVSMESYMLLIMLSLKVVEVELISVQYGLSRYCYLMFYLKFPSPAFSLLSSLIITDCTTLSPAKPTPSSYVAKLFFF